MENLDSFEIDKVSGGYLSAGAGVPSINIKFFQGAILHAARTPFENKWKIFLAPRTLLN